MNSIITFMKSISTIIAVGKHNFNVETRLFIHRITILILHTNFFSHWNFPKKFTLTIRVRHFYLNKQFCLQLNNGLSSFHLIKTPVSQNLNQIYWWDNRDFMWTITTGRRKFVKNHIWYLMNIFVRCNIVCTSNEWVWRLRFLFSLALVILHTYEAMY